MTTHLILGTRGSPLALAQSRQVAAALQAAHPGLQIEERIIRTTGDRRQAAPLPAIGGKGVFTLEIEQALLAGDIDFAVHSLKDLPPQMPRGLCLGAIPKRETACDVCVLRPTQRPLEQNSSLPFLPHGAKVGTSSLRRRAQLLHLRPDLQIEEMRGNIDTRLRKLDEQNADAIVLAQAGLNRLGVTLPPERLIRLDEREFVPAPGQGALAIEARADDTAVLPLLAALDDDATHAEITAERATMRTLNAGCATPLGARASAGDGTLRLWAVVLSPDGTQRSFVADGGRIEEAEALGQSVAATLLEQGAGELLKADR